MINRGLSTISRAARIMRMRLVPKALILLYHRVIEIPSDPHLLSVTPSHFAEHLEVLRKYANPIRLEQAYRALEANKIADRTVVITSDDGYADNLTHAVPLLEQHDVPATVFVTSGYVNGGREFWWDELDRLLLQP